MALVTRASDASIDPTAAQFANQISGLIAGEALDIAAPCHIDQSDGLVYMSNATSANADAVVDGFTPRAVASGQPVTLFGLGARFRYSDGGLTPGARYYLGATDGRLDDGATTGDSVGVAAAINANDIRIIRDS